MSLMKVAYVFATTNSQKILSTMILPQLEAGKHGADVKGMFFFMDNTFFLVEGTPMAQVRGLEQADLRAPDDGRSRAATPPFWLKRNKDDNGLPESFRI